MFYFKKIILYFDYYEYGEKKKSCGYGKLLVKDREALLDLHIRDAGERESCMCDLYACGKRKGHLGRILLDKGTGYYNSSFPGENLDGDGLCIFDVNKLQIRIHENRYCEAVWKWEEIPEGLFGKGEERAQENTPAAAERRERFTEEPELIREARQQAGEPELIREARQQVENPAAVRETQERTEEPILRRGAKEPILIREARQQAEEPAPIRGVQERTQEPAPIRGVQERAEEPAAVRAAQQRIEAPAPLEEAQMEEALHEDKWQQLCSQYPVCHPFEDGEAYITIAPKDFVILRREYQNLVSNSFLLHSFYNYHHVILGKTGTAEREIFYIGVPGAYLEREKKVAVMFGFEGFAMSARGNKKAGAGSPAEPGAFGYYMRKVEI